MDVVAAQTLSPFSLAGSKVVRCAHDTIVRKQICPHPLVEGWHNSPNEIEEAGIDMYVDSEIIYSTHTILVPI